MKSKVDKRTGDDVREDVYDFTKGNHKKKSLRMKEEQMVIKEERMLMVGRTMTGESFLLI